MPRKKVLEHLAALYAVSDDPWHHRTSAYEAEKFATTLAAIGAGPFDNALEIGCGNGTLSRLLAPRCRSLTALECIPMAAMVAARHLADQNHVTIIRGAAPEDLPRIKPDLVLLSEVLYFLTAAEIDELANWLLRRACGPVLAVNWTGPTDETLTGTEAVVLLARRLGQPRTEFRSSYRIDRFDLA